MNANESKGVLVVMDLARDVLAEIYAKHQRAIGPFASQAQKSNGQLREARAAVAEAFTALRGCRDMLRESAKQHRLSGDNGHARHCDTLVDTADAALASVGGAA